MITVLSYSYSRFDLEEEEEEKNIFNASLREKAKRSSKEEAFFRKKQGLEFLSLLLLVYWLIYNVS